MRQLSIKQPKLGFYALKSAGTIDKKITIYVSYTVII